MHTNDQHTIDQYHDHVGRLKKILAQWFDGKLSPAEKRKAIAAENAAYYRGDFKSPATGELLTKAPRVRNYDPLF